MRACLSVCILSAFLCLNGCAVLVPQTATTAATSVATSTGTHTAYNEGLPPTGGTMDGKAKFFDFKGISIPPNLGLEKDRSFIFTVGNVRAGVLAFKGRLEFLSLCNYFRESMAQNKWEFLASSSFPQTALFFAKDDRTCIIRVWETNIYTHVEVWVTPSRNLVRQQESLVR
jgi:hypothetical protein